MKRVKLYLVIVLFSTVTLSLMATDYYLSRLEKETRFSELLDLLPHYDPYDMSCYHEYFTTEKKADQKIEKYLQNAARFVMDNKLSDWLNKLATEIATEIEIKIKIAIENLEIIKVIVKKDPDQFNKSLFELPKSFKTDIIAVHMLSYRESDLEKIITDPILRKKIKLSSTVSNDVLENYGISRRHNPPKIILQNIVDHVKGFNKACICISKTPTDATHLCLRNFNLLVLPYSLNNLKSLIFLDLRGNNILLPNKVINNLMSRHCYILLVDADIARRKFS